MKQDNVGQMIFNETDVCDLLMQGRDIASLKGMLVDHTVDLEKATVAIEHIPDFLKYANDYPDIVETYDKAMQSHWHMPQEYLDMDIAAHVLNLCTTQEQLQRCGEELLLYQERNLFNLLKFLKYLVDVMKQNRIIWGVGRGSSVASYVLYLLEVHRIDSMFYDLDPREFLR
jgi:DNA polymerase III alpha subunit